MAEHVLKISTNSSGAGEDTSDPVYGFIEIIDVKYGGTPDAGTDVTITEVGGPARTLLTLSNSGTDDVSRLRVLVQDGAGADIAGQYTREYLWGSRIKAVVAQGVASTTDAVVVRIVTREDR